MSKRKFDKITKKKLLIPVAKYGKVGSILKDITPDEYKDMKEVQAAVKSGESCLHCSDGHDLVFRNESKDGRRRAHFAHKHDCHNCSDGCNYIKKYGGKGESPEHLQAKLWFGLQPRVVFRVECEQVCGNDIRTVEIPKEWTYKTEHRLIVNTYPTLTYIWVDGAFIDSSGVVQLVVEVKHTHGTTGDKLKWLQNQAFEFFEVGAKTVQNSCNGVVPIINQKNDHCLCEACEKRIIANNLIALQYATKTQSNDKDLAKIALGMNIHAIRFFSVQIALDYIEKNVGRKHVFMRNMPDSLLNNRDIVSIFVKNDGNSLRLASDDLRDDVEIVKLAIDNWRSSVYFASDRVKNILEREDNQPVTDN